MDLNTEINNLMWINLSDYTGMLFESAIAYTPKIISAVLVLWIWFKIINLIEKGITKIMERQKINLMLRGFIISLSNILLKLMVIIMAAWILWVQTSSFVAMLAAAWFAIGMALSGTLQNFAWGVIILLLKPFKNGHYVEIWGYAGTIKEINIFNTVIITPDKKRVIIPNSDIANWSMINYSAEPRRRIDLVIWVAYSEDTDNVKKTLLEIAQKNEKVMKDETIVVWISEFADSSVNFNFRFYVDSADYLDVKYEILEAIKKTFDRKKISFPFPQRDVHLFNKN